MEKLQNFLNLYGKWWENAQKNPESLQESFKRVFKLYPQAIERLFGNNETTEEKIAERVDDAYSNIQLPNRASVMPKSPEVVPYQYRNDGQL